MCIFAIMVIGAKEQFELKFFNFCRRLGIVMLIYEKNLQGFLF